MGLVKGISIFLSNTAIHFWYLNVKFQGFIEPEHHSELFPQGVDFDFPLTQLWLGGTMEPCVGELQWHQKKLQKIRQFSICLVKTSKEVLRIFVQHQRVSSFFNPRWYCKLPPNRRTLLRWFQVIATKRFDPLPALALKFCRRRISRPFCTIKIHQSKISQLAMQSITVLSFIG